MNTLRVVLDQLVAPVPGGIGRYTAELTRELVRTTPSGWRVEGALAARTGASARVAGLLPELTAITTGRWDRRVLSRAWARGVALGRLAGHVHAPSLFAPLLPPHGDDALVATIHDVVPWTHPETLTPHGVAWHREMAARAQRYAAAVVVDTQAVADQLAEVIDFGDRVHVIGAAVSADFAAPTGEAARSRADALGLPERYVLSVGTLEPRKGLDHLVRAMRGVDPEVPLLIVGPPGWGDVSVSALAREAGLPEGRVRTLGRLDDADVALAAQQATVFAFPSLAEGFGLPVLEAFQAGTPVVHSDDPALVEVAGGAGIAVPRAGEGTYADRLGDAVQELLDDESLRARLVTAGRARLDAYSWRASAEQVWRLHTSL